MIKDVNGRFDDYTISPVIRQVLLYLGYEQLKMINYKLNIDRLLKETKDEYHNGGGE